MCIRDSLPTEQTVRLGFRAVQALLGVQLDDQVFLDFEVDIIAVGHTNDLAGKLFAVHIEPHGNRAGTAALVNGFEFLALAGFFRQGDDVAFLDKQGGCLLYTSRCV